jgi:hypothetical protein
MNSVVTWYPIFRVGVESVTVGRDSDEGHRILCTRALLLPWAKSIQTTPSTSNGTTSILQRSPSTPPTLALYILQKKPLTQHRWMWRVWSGLILLMGTAALLAHKIRCRDEELVDAPFCCSRRCAFIKALFFSLSASARCFQKNTISTRVSPPRPTLSLCHKR